MYFHENATDKARRIQDERIKADWNFFVTWEQWVPLKLCPIPATQNVRIPVGNHNIHIRPNITTTSGLPQVTKSNVSSMPSSQPHPEGLPKKHFGGEVFDMCWNTKADLVRTVNTTTATSSAEPQYEGQVFDVCWDTEVDPAPIIVADAATPPAAGSYDLCWDSQGSPRKINLAPIQELAATKTHTLDVTMPLVADQYDMCWNNSPSVSVDGYRGKCQSLPPTITNHHSGDFDMCWEDSTSGGDGHIDSGLVAAPTINMVNLAGDTPVLYDLCFDTSLPATSPGPRDDSPSQTVNLAGDTQVLYDLCFDASLPATSPGPMDDSPSQTVNLAGDTPVLYDLCFDASLPATSPGPRDDSPNQTVEAGEELLRRANVRLDSIDTVIADDPRAQSMDILDANQDLISDYRYACDEFLAASDDIAKIEHLMNMHQQIDDPLHILLLAMRKMGRGDSPIQ
ncbi:uncharacterized protein F5147DRAFT_778818 [Suillus discolor]|uniref:Uncharacterized protein n=1 Tax=Suillus discolor TaxID=1912936 RepID=A0A9P7JP88_9AGAM|nr:uncharacterized protein F5147DRAFT_778818 [Suillus discolor]KAG2095124.1 hypothetical protein F5147DRAFT_778818 [Suillus discolor]